MRGEPTATKGTTIVGIVCKDGTVLAADTRATLGSMVTSERVTKVFQVDDHLAVAGAGLVGDILGLVKVLRAEARLYRAKVGREMSVKALATLLSNILHEGRGYAYFAWFLVGGYDSKPGLYSIDAAGGLTEERYVAAGSGMEFALAVLEENFSEGMRLDEAMKLAVRALKAAIKRDIFTGGKIVLVTITEDGCREMKGEEVEALLQ